MPPGGILSALLRRRHPSLARLSAITVQVSIFPRQHLRHWPDTMEREDNQFYQDIGIDISKRDVLTLTEKDIASSYRKAALKWHPDKNPNDPTASDKFSKIFLAYETLSSPFQRKHYDDKIRQVRNRHKAFELLDETRRLMRHQLHQRELQASHPIPRPAARTREADAHSDNAALSRIRREIERLRMEAIREQSRSEDAAPASSSRPKATPTTSNTTGTGNANNHSLHAGPWAIVPGYADFRSKSPPFSFQQLEDAILNGHSPFNDSK